MCATHRSVSTSFKALNVRNQLPSGFILICSQIDVDYDIYLSVFLLFVFFLSLVELLLLFGRLRSLVRCYKIARAQAQNARPRITLLLLSCGIFHLTFFFFSSLSKCKNTFWRIWKKKKRGKSDEYNDMKMRPNCCLPLQAHTTESITCARADTISRRFILRIRNKKETKKKKNEYYILFSDMLNARLHGDDEHTEQAFRSANAATTTAK